MAGGRRFLAAVASAALLAPANLALVPRGLAPSTRRRKIQNQNQAAYRAASSDADRPSSHGRLALLKRIIKRGDIRGADRYGSTNNSTILAPADAGEIEVICSWCSSVPLFITEVSIRYCGCCSTRSIQGRRQANARGVEGDLATSMETSSFHDEASSQVRFRPADRLQASPRMPVVEGQ